MGAEAEKSLDISQDLPVQTSGAAREIGITSASVLAALTLADCNPGNTPKLSPQPTEAYQLQKGYSINLRGLTQADVLGNLKPHIAITSFTSGENIITAACRNAFGVHNVKVTEDGKAMEVTYPAGKFAAKSGFGAICPIPQNEGQVMSVSYTMQVPEDFPLGKGLKLNGICFHECPRGAEKGNGSSIRAHSRIDSRVGAFPSVDKTRNGFSAYIHGKGNVNQYTGNPTQKPVHFADKDITLEPGKSYKIEMIVIPGTGKLIVKIDDQILYETTRDTFKTTTPDWSLMFSTFRGGGDASWSVDRDSSLTFRDFEVKHYNIVVKNKTGQ